MKTQNHKIVAILLVIVTILSFILPSLTPQINASPEDSDYYIQKHIVTDNYTNNVNKDALSNGEVWVDKTVSTGPITIDGYDFETEEFIVQLSSIAKQVQQSKEPADIVILLDVTGSSSNPIKGYGITATGRNGSNSFLVMAVNEFIDIVMQSDSRNKVAVITYGGTNMYIQGTDTRLGSAPVYTLLELGHYSNPSWTHEETYIVTEGEGSVEDKTYMGGKIVEGKYISFYESSWQNSVWDYIEDESIRNLTWVGNNPRYTFKVQSNEQIQKDGTLYPKTTSYTNWGGTGTQNAIHEGTNYLLDHVNSETAVLVVLTDGLPTIVSFDYAEDLDYCSDEVTHKEYTPPATNDGKSKWTQVIHNYDSTKVLEKDEDRISNAVLTIAGATYNKERLKEVYENTYIYTVSVYDNDISHLVLDPSNLATDTTADGIEIYNYLENIFKNNKTVTLPNDAVVTKKTTTNDYCYSDNYYFAQNANIAELVSSFEDITKLISGNACGEIVFTDILGSNMELKSIKGIIIDGILYTSFVKTNNTYTFPELDDLNIVVSTENNKQKITYTIPEPYIESLVRLVFEEGVVANYDYTSAEEHTFYSNTSCEAKFILANNNNYNGFNKTVNKSQNKTNTATHVSQSIKDDLEVTVNLGNNGLLTVNRLENKIDLKLTKIWNDNNDILGFRPDSIRVNIYNGVVLTATTTLTKAENMVDANTWEKTISLPKYTEEGEIIEYTIEEEEIILENGDKYTPLINGSTITNVLTHTGKISITKIWKDDSNKYLTRPDSIEVIIMKNGQDYKTITLSAENATTVNSDIWQVIDIDAPAYDANGNKNTYTIRENTNNINLIYYYNDPVYDQNTLTVTNEAVWLPIKSNSHPEYRITILKEIINKDNVLATANDFNKVKLNINDTFEFPIILKELKRTLTKGENSMVETYGDYTGNIYRGIVTNNNQLIFSKINPGKYEISEESVEYFNFIDFSEISKSEGAMFTKENGKYYITLSGITGNYEDIVVKVTNKIDETREYNKTQGKDNLLKQLPLRINSLFDPIPPIPPEPKPGEVYVNKIVNTDKIIVEGEEFYSEDFLIQLETIIKQVHESKEPVDIMIMLDSTGSTHNPIYGYGLDAENRNGSQDDFIVAINEFIDIIMASHEENRIGVTCYGAYNRIFKNTTVRYGSEPMFTILELGHYTNPDWTHSKSYIFTPGEGSIANKTYKGGGVIQGKYISWFESSQNNTVWDYLNDTSISATTRKATWFSHRFGYNYKLQTHTSLKKDDAAYAQKNFYGGVAYTGTQNAILCGVEKLQQEAKGETGILILMTDGVPNVVRTDYTKPLDVNDPATSTQYISYSSTDKEWTVASATKGSNIKQVNNARDAAVTTIMGAVYARQQLLNTYDNAFLFTISNVNTEYADCLLDPIEYTKATTSQNKEIRTILNSVFNENKSVKLDCGITVSNNTGATNYIYNDAYFYADDIDSLTTSLKAIFDTIKGNASGDVVFKDTLGSDIDFKGIKAIFVDDKEYTNFVENGNTYSCPDLPGITIVLTEENNRWLVTYTVPTTYSNKYVKLIFEAGVRDDFVFESNELYTFYSNHSCIVNFTLTENNPYDDYDRIILKPDNITNTDPYISQGMINDKDVTIQLGNNGVMEIFN